jgi:hypothetical protein
MPEEHFKDNGDFVCSCGATIFRTQTRSVLVAGVWLWHCMSCKTVWLSVSCEKQKEMLTDANEEAEYSHEWLLNESKMFE